MHRSPSSGCGALGMAFQCANVTAMALVRLADWGDMHSLLGDPIIWLAGLHAAAAIFHHVKLKDGVLGSIAPWLKRR